MLKRHSLRAQATLLRLGGFKANLLEDRSVRGKLLLPNRKSVGCEQKRKNIGILFPAQSSRLIRWHGGLHLLEQVIGTLPVPIALEIGAGKTPLMNPADAAFRADGVAEAPDGSLYIGDSQKGRIWHVYYRGK